MMWCQQYVFHLLEAIDPATVYDYLLSPCDLHGYNSLGYCTQDLAHLMVSSAQQLVTKYSTFTVWNMIKKRTKKIKITLSICLGSPFATTLKDDNTGHEK